MKPLASYSLADPETISDPFEYYARMRAEQPVHFDERARAWMVTRFDDVQQALRMTEDLSNQLGFEEALRSPYQDEVDEMMRREGFGPHRSSDNFQVDPPLHAVRRGLVNMAFSGQRVATMETHIAQIVHEVTDNFVDRGEADMVREFSVPIAIYVISDLLNVPRDRIDDVKRWSDAAVAPFGRGLTREQLFAYARDTMDMHRYLAGALDERRHRRGDDLISDLVHARMDDDQHPQLSMTELLSIGVALLAAGNETTRNGISFGTWILAEHPKILRSIRDADDLNQSLRQFVEEVLRIEPPVPQLPRFAVRDCKIGGATIRQGDHVFLCFASANRDGGKFEQADKFIWDRKNAGQHLTFGAGIHRCIGAMLARMEMKCAFREIVQRFADFQLALAHSEVEIWATFLFRGPLSLPVRFTKGGHDAIER
jgi:cytochrome P450